MKKVILILVILSVGFPSIAQSIPDQTLSMELITKSEKQKKSGIIFFAGGLASTFGSIVIQRNYASDAASPQAKDILLVAGLSSMAVSVHLFARSGTNARNAAKLNLENYAISTPTFPKIKNIPSLSLKIPL